jgi:hypothetical protein
MLRVLGFGCLAVVAHKLLLRCAVVVLRILHVVVKAAEMLEPLEGSVVVP